MKTHQIKKSWTVYPPNYKPGDGYYKRRFLKQAQSKASELGIGSEIHSCIETKTKLDTTTSFSDIIYVMVKS